MGWMGCVWAGVSFHIHFRIVHLWAGVLCSCCPRPLCIAHDGVLAQSCGIGFMTKHNGRTTTVREKKKWVSFPSFLPALPCHAMPSALPCPAHPTLPSFPSLSFSLPVSPIFFSYVFIYLPYSCIPILPPSQRYALTRSCVPCIEKQQNGTKSRALLCLGAPYFFFVGCVYLPCVFHLKCGLLEKALLHRLGWKKNRDQSTPSTLDYLWLERRRGSERRWMSISWVPTKERPYALRLKLTFLISVVPCL